MIEITNSNYPTVEFKDERWIATLARCGSSTRVICETREDAERIVDVGRVLDLLDSGGVCNLQRLKVALAILARYGYGLPHNLAREVWGYMEEIARADGH